MVLADTFVNHMQVCFDVLPIAITVLISSSNTNFANENTWLSTKFRESNFKKNGILLKRSRIKFQKNGILLKRSKILKITTIRINLHRLIFFLKIKSFILERLDQNTCNKYSVMQSVLAEMSSRTALTKHLEVEGNILDKYINANMF